MRLNATKEDIISFICLRWLRTTEIINCYQKEKWPKFWPFLSRKSHHPIETLFILFGVQQEIRNYIKNNTMDTIKTQREERDK